jgi:uncharacterized hydrophobic protein (TIGR00271 family)
MGMKGLFADFDEKSKSDAVKRLIAESTPDKDFFFMVILSSLMATFGLLLGNVPVIIGSMLIAPLLSPVLSLALGIVMADGHLISRAFFTLVRSLLFAVFLSAVVALFFLPFVDSGSFSEAYRQWDKFIVYFGVAIVAGLAASFASVAPHLNAILPGAAIAVTLIPPMAAMGVGFASFDWNAISGSFVVFFINVLGMVFAAMIMFSLMDLRIKRTVARRAIKQEDHKNGVVADTQEA